MAMLACEEFLRCWKFKDKDVQSIIYCEWKQNPIITQSGNCSYKLQENVR